MPIIDSVKKVGAFGAAVTIIEGTNQIFDYILYPAGILWLGPVYGGIVMTTLAMVANYVVIIWYNRTKQDWFGLEWLRLQETIESQSFLGKLLRWFIHLGRWPAFLGISIYDPAYGFIFLRGRKSTGLNLTTVDWWWFVISNLIGNLVWILIITGAIEGIKQFFYL